MMSLSLAFLALEPTLDGMPVGLAFVVKVLGAVLETAIRPCL